MEMSSEIVLLDGFPEDAVVLVLDPVQIFQIGPHLFGGLGHLGHLDEFEIKIFQNGFAQFVVEQGVSASALEFGQNTHAVPGDGLGALHFNQADPRSRRGTGGPWHAGGRPKHPGRQTKSQQYRRHA